MRSEVPFHLTVPNKPKITTSTSHVVENHILTMTCSARSITRLPSNLPSDLKPVMEYQWQRNNHKLTNDGRHGVSGNRLTIDKVQRQDNMVTYSCIAQESGSKLRNSASKTVDVKYKPGRAHADRKSFGPYFKQHSSTITLSCSVSDSGNPEAMFKWTKDGLGKGETKQGYYPKSSGQLSVSDDDGLWQCTPYNETGEGQADSINVIVYDPLELNAVVTPKGDLIQGSKVTIACIVDSRPEPSSLLWTNITVPGLPDIACSQGNNTHCLLRFTNISILDSGIYQCQADNGIRGSPVTLNKTLTVYGPPRWYKLDPVDSVNGVGIGSSTKFKVWIIARPLPHQEDWQWKFSPTKSSNVMTTKPAEVLLTVSGDMAVLSIINVTLGHYGNYFIWTSNKYGGWNEEDLMFSLKPQGPPLEPINFHVTDVTAVSIRVQWIRGFNGGLEQTFTIRYTNIATGVIREKSDIEDTDGSRQMITDVITDVIEPETEYQLQIIAHNSLGQAVGGNVSTVTPALARFINGHDVTIQGSKAEIHFITSGQLTQIIVENCVEGTETCLTENVTIPQKTRNKCRATEPFYDFKEEIALVDAKVKMFIFSFWFYDGDILLFTESSEVKLHLHQVNCQVIIGAFLGVLLLIIVVVVITVLRRKGLIAKNICKNMKITAELVQKETIREISVNSSMRCQLSH